uniref:Uncharacterized protein n=1 Tax=Rhizophora mucronata TaxID=61149 RepID=A0A2P2MYE0_RHIMU
MGFAKLSRSTTRPDLQILWLPLLSPFIPVWCLPIRYRRPIRFMILRFWMWGRTLWCHCRVLALITRIIRCRPFICPMW